MDNILITIGCSVVCIILTLLVSYFLPKGKIKQANQQLEKDEQQKLLDIQKLENQQKEKENELNALQANIELSKNNWEKEQIEQELKLTQQQKDLEVAVKGLEERRSSIIESLEQEAKESGRIFKEQQLQLAKEQIEAKTLEMEQEFETAKEQARFVYLNELADAVQDFQQKTMVSEAELDQHLKELSEARSKAQAAMEANKRLELTRAEKDFYKLQLSSIDLEEIAKIRSIEPYLRNKEPLNKVIWKVYYEKPYTDLIGRVVGSGRHTGIYKITNLNSGMCYIGQAVDIADRWKQHIKRGVGAETPTRNKLYPAMLAEGVENFMFEIIEECASKDLNEREDYWQDFYGAKEFGYSIK